ncbi:MAG: hypothetical protein ACTSWG_10565 [Candidatus Helarchaeota archaeon]
MKMFYILIEERKQIKKELNMNYTSVKIGFTIGVAVLGIIFAHNVIKSFTSIMEVKSNQLELIYSINK